MGLPELPESPHQQETRRVAEVSFRDRATVSSIYLGLPGENGFWNRRIIIYRLRLLDHRFWVSLDMFIFSGCQNIASGVA